MVRELTLVTEPALAILLPCSTDSVTGSPISVGLRSLLSDLTWARAPEVADLTVLSFPAFSFTLIEIEPTFDFSCILWGKGLTILPFSL